MKHTYLIYSGPELLVATIESDGPLPHLTEGASLLLDSDAHPGKPGKYLVVDHVEVVMSYLSDKLARNDIHVHCKETERSPVR
jgi:hypothetical protein